MSSNKQYGLQIPKKNTHGMVQKHAAFGDDSDSEKSDGGGTDWTKKALKVGDKGSIKRQTKIDMQRALEQDSTVYQYDEVYDQMEKGKQDKYQRDKDRKPKYIQKLLVSAEKRKIENERRIERQVQKEREAEGDEFKDKETFVTAAYKKKLEEFAKLDAEQRRQDMLEDICDVSKQQDISGFYRHLYQQTMNGPKEDSPSKNNVSKDDSETHKKDSHRQIHQSGNGHNEDSSKTNFSKEEKKSDSKKADLKKDRHYRKRKESESSVERNKDSDGDSSSSSSSSGDSDSEKSSHSETEDPKRIRSKEYSSTVELDPAEAIPITESTILPQPEPQRSIWEKRTVGHVFDAALKRYIERKNARLAAVS